MSELLEKEIIEIIGYVKEAAEFSKEHLPSVASQILEYGYISNLTGVIILPIITIISMSISLYNRYDMPFFSSISALIFLVWSICCIDSLIKVIYAPKLYLLSYLKGLI